MLSGVSSVSSGWAGVALPLLIGSPGCAVAGGVGGSCGKRAREMGSSGGHAGA